VGLTEFLTMFSLRKRERWLREKTILSKRVSPFDFVFTCFLCLCVCVCVFGVCWFVLEYFWFYHSMNVLVIVNIIDEEVSQ